MGFPITNSWVTSGSLVQILATSEPPPLGGEEASVGKIRVSDQRKDGRDASRGWNSLDTGTHAPQGQSEKILSCVDTGSRTVPRTSAVAARRS
jgi:hypothetical protein